MTYDEITKAMELSVSAVRDTSTCAAATGGCMDKQRMIDVTSCNEIRSLMADWLDDELTPVFKIRVDEHLADCRECRDAFSMMQGLGADLVVLGRVADRIADSALSGSHRLRFWHNPWTRAAAVVLLVVGGAYFARVRLSINEETGVGERTRQGNVVPLALIESTVHERDCRAIGRTAVAIATANPRVRIVWLYDDAGVGIGSTNSGGGPKPRPQS
jgi:hypothetical protein